MVGKKKINKKNLGTSFDRLLNYNLKNDEAIEAAKKIIDITLPLGILLNCLITQLSLIFEFSKFPIHSFKPIIFCNSTL